MTPTKSPNPCAWWVPLAGGLAHAACMALAAPPLSAWPFALLSIFPLVWAAHRCAPRPLRALLLSTLGIVPLWAFWQAWVLDVSELGYAPFCAAVALFTGAFLGLLALVRRRLPRVPFALAVPVLWTGLEFVRGELAFEGYAWGFAAHPLIDAPALAQPAALGGFYLVSLLLAAGTGAAADLSLARPRRPRWALGSAGVMVLVLVSAQVLSPAERSGRTVLVAAVQTNVPQSNKMGWTLPDERRDLERFAELTRQAAADRPALIAWPETMVPGMTLEADAIALLGEVVFRVEGAEPIPADTFARQLLDLQRELDIPMLVGEDARVGMRLERLPSGGLAFPFDRRHNSAYLITAGAVSPSRYDKLRLTPFGETMPYVRHWPALQQRLLDLGAAGMAFDLSEGRERTVFSIPAEGGPVRVVTPICFESTMASLCRRLTYDAGRRRADLIVNLTNDGWFGSSLTGRLQHLQAARWRSLELNTPTLRAANTGISAAIDARGRVLALGVRGGGSPAFRDGVLVHALPLGLEPTPYARLGDAPGWAALTAAGLVLLAAFLPARRTQPPPAK
jgi:apolipoprotein N-acyltransferase